MGSLIASIILGIFKMFFDKASEDPVIEIGKQTADEERWGNAARDSWMSS